MITGALSILGGEVTYWWIWMACFEFGGSPVNFASISTRPFSTGLNVTTPVVWFPSVGDSTATNSVASTITGEDSIASSTGSSAIDSEGALIVRMKVARMLKRRAFVRISDVRKFARKRKQ
jgi:hypothetical protein